MDSGEGIFFGVIFLFSLAITLVMIAGMWKSFQKAGKPGWACLVPIYNIVVLFEIAGLPLWMILGFFIPLLNLGVSIWLNYNIAKRFGGGIGLTILLIFGIGWLMIGFGDAKYEGSIDLQKGT